MLGEAVTFIRIAAGLIAVPEAAATVYLPDAFPWAMIFQPDASATAGTTRATTATTRIRLMFSV